MRMDQKTMIVMVCFCDHLLHDGIGGEYFMKPFTKQIAPLCGKTISGDVFHLHPFAIHKAAFGDNQMNMRLIPQVTPGSVYSVDQSNLHPRIEFG
jgi:hypothetical protein